ncbi:MAG TPA: hypothetical protein VFG15_06425 [Amycolatopsis sp.]|nr:hypothetical protein [Amycolatopsis sp.]
MVAVIAMTDADYVPRPCVDWISGGQVIHDFLTRELEDDSLLWLIPRCQGSAARPIRVPRLGMSDRTSPRAKACVPCASLRRRDRITRCPLIWRR